MDRDWRSGGLYQRRHSGWRREAIIAFAREGARVVATARGIESFPSLTDHRSIRSRI